MAVTDRQPDSLLMPAQQPSSSSSLSVTLQILSIVFYTFIAFICIGLPIAVLPGYVHDQLGFSAVVAGLAIASQYLATLLSRPSAGRLVDSIGTKPAIVYGLAGIAISGVLTSLAVALQDWPLLSLGVLIVGRVFLGIAQGLSVLAPSPGALPRWAHNIPPGRLAGTGLRPTARSPLVRHWAW